MALNRIPSLAKFDGKNTLQHLEKKCLLKVFQAVQ